MGKRRIQVCVTNTKYQKMDHLYIVNPEGIVFKNRHCALCHGVSDTESFDVRFIVSDKLVDKLLTANLSKGEKKEHYDVAIFVQENST